VRRITVVGCPGNGKTTLARQLADGLGLRHIELDSLFHVSDWESATADEFRRDLAAALDDAPGGWVTCGNYLTMSAEVHIARADTLVWLDLPRRVVTWRTAKRTLRRSLTREPLFGNGLTEPVGNFTRWDPEKNIIRWAWIHHPIYREDLGRRISSASWKHLDIHRLATADEVDGFLAGALHRQG
jgi:adenylate kinase family enzyme